MNKESLKTVKRNEKNRIIIVFVTAYNLTLNRPSKTPHAAWAIIENTNNQLVIIKESRSTTEYFAKQDIGYTLHSSWFPEHYNVSKSQYDNLFGEDQWDKKWLDFEQFQNWKAEREIIIDKDAKSLQ